MPQLKVTIDTVGRPKIEGDGFVGNACKVASKPYEDKLTSASAKDTDVIVEEKEEMHMINPNKTSLHEIN